MTAPRTPAAERGAGADLMAFTANKQPDGTWKVVRIRAESGETFICDDLHDVIDTVLAAYYPDGTPRPWPRTGP